MLFKERRNISRIENSVLNVTLAALAQLFTPRDVISVKIEMGMQQDSK